MEVAVAVIGNGPSGILTSLLLSGYQLTYNQESPHPDANLHEKLRLQPDWLKWPLEELCKGLEGRSKNPMALLIDTLNLPYADSPDPAPCALQMKLCQELAISHVVLGVLTSKYINLEL